MKFIFKIEKGNKDYFIFYRAATTILISFYIITGVLWLLVLAGKLSSPIGPGVHTLLYMGLFLLAATKRMRQNEKEVPYFKSRMRADYPKKWFFTKNSLIALAVSMTGILVMSVLLFL